MTHSTYPSDVSDTQWAEVRSLLSAPGGGRPRTYDLRDVVDAVLYVQRTGCPWRLLPHDFPPWRTVHYHLRRWTEAGVWDRLTIQLQGRKRAPLTSAAKGSRHQAQPGQRPVSRGAQTVSPGDAAPSRSRTSPD